MLPVGGILCERCKDQCPSAHGAHGARLPHCPGLACVSMGLASPKGLALGLGGPAGAAPAEGLPDAAAAAGSPSGAALLRGCRTSFGRSRGLVGRSPGPRGAGQARGLQSGRVCRPDQAQNAFVAHVQAAGPASPPAGHRGSQPSPTAPSANRLPLPLLPGAEQTSGQLTSRGPPARRPLSVSIVPVGKAAAAPPLLKPPAPILKPPAPVLVTPTPTIAATPASQRNRRGFEPGAASTAQRQHGQTHRWGV